MIEIASLGPRFDSERLHHLGGRKGFDGIAKAIGDNRQVTTLTAQTNKR
jgi:hypothetical protein